MNNNPNLITESGREHLSLADRAGLLEADVLDLQMNAPKYDHRRANEDWHTNGHPVHAFNQLLGSIRSCVIACRDPDATAKAWGRLNLSKTECCVLAWRRGGVTEHDRVKALAYRDYRTPIFQLVRLLKAIIPLAASAYVGRCYCGRAIPWERRDWANPACYAHDGLEEDAHDCKRRGKLEAMVREIGGLDARPQ